jgi:hypothetical protein
LVTLLHAAVQSDAADIAVFLLGHPKIPMLPRDVVCVVCISSFLR